MKVKKKSVVKTKRAPKLNPNTDLGSIDRHIKFDCDNNKDELIDSTVKSKFTVKNVKAKIVVATLLTFVEQIIDDRPRVAKLDFALKIQQLVLDSITKSDD